MSTETLENNTFETKIDNQPEKTKTEKYEITPQDFICPITQLLATEPVSWAGTIFHRPALNELFEGKTRAKHPILGKEMEKPFFHVIKSVQTFILMKIQTDKEWTEYQYIDDIFEKIDRLKPSHELKVDIKQKTVYFDGHIHDEIDLDEIHELISVQSEKTVVRYIKGCSKELVDEHMRWLSERNDITNFTRVMLKQMGHIHFDITSALLYAILMEADPTIFPEAISRNPNSGLIERFFTSKTDTIKRVRVFIYMWENMKEVITTDSLVIMKKHLKFETQNALAIEICNRLPIEKPRKIVSPLTVVRLRDYITENKINLDDFVNEDGQNVLHLSALDEGKSDLNVDQNIILYIKVMYGKLKSNYMQKDKFGKYPLDYMTTCDGGDIHLYIVDHICLNRLVGIEELLLWARDRYNDTMFEGVVGVISNRGYSIDLNSGIKYSEKWIERQKIMSKLQANSD